MKGNNYGSISGSKSFLLISDLLSAEIIFCCFTLECALSMYQSLFLSPKTLNFVNKHTLKHFNGTHIALVDMPVHHDEHDLL